MLCTDEGISYVNLDFTMVSRIQKKRICEFSKAKAKAYKGLLSFLADFLMEGQGLRGELGYRKKRKSLDLLCSAPKRTNLDCLS